MYMIPAEHENKIRPPAAIGSERAARLGSTQNRKPSQNLAAQDNQKFSLPVGDCWSNSSGDGETPAPPRAMAAIGSERAARLAALKNPNPRQNSSNKKNSDGSESKEVMYKIPAANEKKRRPQAAIGSERAARLAAMENLDSGHNSPVQHNPNLDLSMGDCWPNLSGDGEIPAPPRVLAAIGSERAARLAALENLDPRQNSAVRQLESSPPSLPLQDDDDGLLFCVNPAAHWSCMSVLPGWQKDPLKEVHPRPSHTFSIFPPEETAAQGPANQQQLETIFEPYPDSDHLPTPAPTLILTTKPKELDLLFNKTPVPANSSWVSTLPERKGKEELKIQPDLPLLYDEQILEDLHCVQAKNHRLTEHILNLMPNEQRRHQFLHELMRRQLRSEQQLTHFLEGKLGQDASESESQCVWVSWFGNGEDTADAGAEGKGRGGRSRPVS